MCNKAKLSDFAHKVDIADIPGDYRTAARRLSLQFLHHLTIQGKDDPSELISFLAEYSDQPGAHELAKKWILGTWRHRDHFDQMIQSASTNWDISRINLVDRNNLRLALYQLIHCPDIPPSVVINEAIELAKTFSTAQAPAFVNALLDTLRQQIESQNLKRPNGETP